MLSFTEGGVDDGGARCLIGGIIKARADARAGLNDHLVTMAHGFLRGIGCHPDAKFLGFDFRGAADFHVWILLRLTWLKSAANGAQGD